MFQNLPFCINFGLMLPSMSIQCTVYFHTENLNAIHIPKCSQIIWNSLFSPAELATRFPFHFSFCLFAFSTSTYKCIYNIEIKLWATDIGIKCSYRTFLPINCVFAICLVFVYIHTSCTNLFVYSVPLRMYTKFDGESDTKIASIPKCETEWSTMFISI